MTKATATAIFHTELAADKSAPGWVQLFPAGPTITARDGRRWAADPRAVVSAFAANRGPLPIDYEHGQDHLAPQGHAAPAAGWIIDVEERNGEVWGKVEWTDKAAAMIAAREYRFISPAFNHTKDGRITRLLGAGLVNRPALQMKALSREAAGQEPTTQETEDMKAIARALGLGEDADEAAILAAIAARNGERAALAQALKLDPEKADQAAITGAIAALQQEAQTATAALQQAPDKAELAAIRQSLADTTAALDALRRKDADREIDAALDAAQAEGKITPASRETYRAMCATEGGLERFKALAATLPVICEPTRLGERQADTRGQELDPYDLAAEANRYQEEQRQAGRMISFSDAVLTVKEKKGASA